MKGTRNIALLVIAGLLLILGVWGCNGYNGVVRQDENVKKALAFSDNYLKNVTDDQLTKDADFCTDVVMITNRDE